MENLKEIFLTLHDLDAYKRVSESHPIAWYVGVDGVGRFSLFAKTATTPDAVSSTNMIHVFIGRRRDGDFGITFSLIERNNLDLFVYFCTDMIESTQTVRNPDRAAGRICARYIQWQKAFRKIGNNLLSYEQIKGLLGELCFLKMGMIPKYGAEQAVESWCGIEQSDQDFVCEDTWYEVKSSVSGASFVRISSVEQLDADRDGHLVVVTLDKTSELDNSRITLNGMIKIVMEALGSPLMKEKLTGKLLESGYIQNDAYDSICFKYNGMSFYSVTSSFPCLRARDLPVSVHNVNYELSLSAIAGFKEA